MVPDHVALCGWKYATRWTRGCTDNILYAAVGPLDLHDGEGASVRMNVFFFYVYVCTWALRMYVRVRIRAYYTYIVSSRMMCTFVHMRLPLFIIPTRICLQRIRSCIGNVRGIDIEKKSNLFGYYWYSGRERALLTSPHSTLTLYNTMHVRLVTKQKINVNYCRLIVKNQL